MNESQTGGHSTQNNDLNTNLYSIWTISISRKKYRGLKKRSTGNTAVAPVPQNVTGD
jgi:hypothetical protein